MSFCDDVRGELDRELKSREAKEFFKRLQDRNSELSGFAGLDDFLQFLWTKTEDPASACAQDRALQCLLRELHRGQEPILNSVLLRLFCPVLINEYVRFQNSDDEVWSDLLDAFYETIAHYPLDRRPRSIAANIKLDTLKRFLALRRGHGTWEAIEPLPDEITDMRTCPLDQILQTADKEIQEQLFQFATQTDCIPPQDLYLIIATRVDGRKLDSLAAELGMTSDQVRMRRDRALKRLGKIVGEKFGGSV